MRRLKKGFFQSGFVRGRILLIQKLNFFWENEKKIIQQDLFEETFDVEIKWFFALGIAEAIMCEGICQGFCAKEKNLQLRGEIFIYLFIFFVISRITYPTTMLRQFHF